jgi:hypothetical protein
MGKSILSFPLAASRCGKDKPVPDRAVVGAESCGRNKKNGCPLFLGHPLPSQEPPLKGSCVFIIFLVVVFLLSFFSIYLKAIF